MQHNMDVYRWSLQEHWRRETGSLRPLAFARHVGGCQDLIRRFHLHAELDGHVGCVNTLHFNTSGDILVTGSDDRQIALWDWAAKLKKLSFYSGHEDNVFQARIMPFSDDKTIISSSADGQVRQADIGESGSVVTKKLAQHQGRVHKLAVEPGSSRIFMSCGEDGVVRRFDMRDPNNKGMFKCHGLTGISRRKRYPVRLNCIVVNTRNPTYFAVGGSDKYARVYDIRKTFWSDGDSESNHVEALFPAHLNNRGPLHVTALAYSHQEELLVSYSDEQIYLFEKGAQSGSASTSDTDATANPAGKEPQVYKGHRNAHTIKGVSFLGPNSEYVVSGSDCGNIFIWKKKGAELVSLFKGDNQVVNCLEAHPHVTFLATSGMEHTAKVWGPISKEYVPLPKNAEKIMRSNQRGREEGFQRLADIIHVMRVQRRHAQPVLASWYSRRDIGRDARWGGGDDESEDDGSVVNGYLMVLHGGIGDESDDEEDTDDQYSMNDCAIV